MKARVIDHHYYLEHTSDTLKGSDVEDSIRITFNPVQREVSEYNGQILINEIRPHKDSAKQWIEFVLRNEEEIDLAGWRIITKHGQSYFKDTVLANQQIVVVDSLWFASGFVNLSKEEDYVYLLDEKGHLIDAINYKEAGRTPLSLDALLKKA